jgi:hypothetical protein
MDDKTLLLILIGGGIAAYLAYSLSKSAQAQPSGGGDTGGGAGQTPPVAVDYGNAGTGLGSGFGLSNLSQQALCRVAPSLCWNPAPPLW